jgi:hypothetical protein
MTLVVTAASEAFKEYGVHEGGGWKVRLEYGLDNFGIKTHGVAAGADALSHLEPT